MVSKTEQIDLSTLDNRSILIVDDNNSVHRDYRAILRPDPNEGKNTEIDQLEALLLGEGDEAPTPPALRNFKLQFALQGKEAHQLITSHLSKGIRYPLAFIDMRMPPGWDGLETILKIRDLDPDMRFVIVTAYSDYSDEELKKRIGEKKLVEIIYKPFDPKEIYRLAYEILADANSSTP